MNVAILDDDAARRASLASIVEGGGHRTTALDNGHALLGVLSDHVPFDALLLDWSVADPSGGRVLASLRDGLAPELPVIVVTACGDDDGGVGALHMGADDFVVRPPAPRVLLARIEAVTRRARAAHATAQRAGRFVVDHARRTVTLDGREIALTLKEFDLAAFLFRHPSALVTRARLLETVWAVDAAGARAADSRTVDTHASRVRRKLQLDGRSGWALQSVYGSGYRLVPA